MLKNYFILFFAIFLSFQAAAQCWNQVWSDEFEGTNLDLNKWSYQTGGSGWGNNELQNYTDRSVNSSVDNGTLKINLIEENFGGNDYTSARLRTINKGDWTYGRMEARIKIPGTQGIWPAFWMMPTTSTYGIWPRSGEMDILEHVGHTPGVIYGTVHTEAYNHTMNTQQGSSITINNPFTQFHTYAAEWDANEYRVYVDGTQFFTFQNDGTGNYATWPFDHDFHLILNVATGGGWAGPPDETTVFPATMEVDYVRVHQTTDMFQLKGLTQVAPNETGLTYSVPNVVGATFVWTSPNGTTITAGDGTHEITVDWGNQSGGVVCEIQTACGPETLSLNVITNPNMFLNPEFEEDFTNWLPRTSGTGAANFNIVTDDVVQGAKAAQVQVTATGNPWDVQLNRIEVPLENGVNYTLKFWAKSSVPGAHITTSFIHPTNFNVYVQKQYFLTDTWEEYMFEFDAPISLDVTYTMDLGRTVTDLYFDNFTFAKSENLVLPIEMLSNLSAKMTENAWVQLDWATQTEVQNSHFIIERSKDGRRFEALKKVKSKGDSQEPHFYQYTDIDPFEGINYYRLQQVDLNGKVNYSPLVWVENRALNVRLQSSLVSSELQLLTEENLEYSAMNLYISDVNGRIWKHDMNNGLIDVADLPSGIYFLSMEKGRSQEVLKFVKQ